MGSALRKLIKMSVCSSVCQSILITNFLCVQLSVLPTRLSNCLSDHRSKYLSIVWVHLSISPFVCQHFICLSVCLSSVCLAVCLLNHLSIYLPVCLSVDSTICLSVCHFQSVYLLSLPSICLSLSVCLSVDSTICLSLHLFVPLSTHPAVLVPVPITSSLPSDHKSLIPGPPLEPTALSCPGKPNKMSPQICDTVDLLLVNILYM